MTLYLKYRPQKLEDLDIASVRDSLTNFVKSGNIPHAFLFCGPKGTGKTSAARILAKIINCTDNKLSKPCNHCENCLTITSGTNMDVVEMDAASNRGIDDIRVLRDVVKFTPTNAKAKIYIIDEAHMLTNDASNALLKTLEEPPNHVYFILATTNPEKLIETIRSRTTIVNFTKATSEETKNSLNKIIESEKIKINNNDIEKIIHLSNGSFRDAVKFLEQFSKDASFLNNQKSFEVNDFLKFLIEKKSDKAIHEIENAIKHGNSIEEITKIILSDLQQKMLETKDPEVIKLIEYILDAQDYNNVSPIEELPLELAIVKWCTL